MNLRQLVNGGKWHVETASGRTACGMRVPLTAPNVQRDEDLVDSTDRCRDVRCARERAQRR